MLGLMCKEITITLIAMVVYYELLLNNQWLKNKNIGLVFWKLFLRVTPYLASATVYFTAPHITR